MPASQEHFKERKMGDSQSTTKRRRYAAGSSSSNSSTSMTSACVSHGWISIMGRSRVMQDALVVVQGIGPGHYDIFGLYDGRTGAAKWCDRLHELVLEEIEERELNSQEWLKVMESSFERIDDEVRGRGGGLEDGSMAVVVVVGQKEIVVASRGDSTAVLFRRDVAFGFSRHSLFERDGPNEKRSWKPMVRIVNRREEDKFVVIASNGLWDVMSDEVTCQVVRRCLNREQQKEEEEEEDTRESLGATRAAAILAGLAMARGSKDNISVVVVQLVNSVVV